jgi:hypothetical protein
MENDEPEVWIAKCYRNPIGETGNYNPDTLILVSPNGHNFHISDGDEEIMFEDVEELARKLNAYEEHQRELIRDKAEFEAFEKKFDTKEKTNEYLISEGYDPEKLAEEGVIFVNTLMRLVKARKGLESLRLQHRYCEDSWYSCPMHPDGCADGTQKGCNCGAAEHNAKIDALLEETK